MSSRSILRFACLFLAFSLSAAGQTIPRGHKIFVQLDRTLTSNGAKSGDTFEATLAQNVEVGGRVLAPAGARVRGYVSLAETSEGQQKPGTLTIELSSIELEKASYPLSTTSVTRRGKERKSEASRPGPATVAGSVIDVLAAGRHAPLETPQVDANAEVGGKGGLEAIMPAQLVMVFKTRRETKAVSH